MAAVYSMQPLFPFIELHIGDQLVTSYTDKFVDCVIDLTYTRGAESSNGDSAGNKWTITLYDDTAVEVEYLLSQKSDGGIKIAYGFARDAKTKISTNEVSGTFTKYSLNFDNVGATLVIDGTITALDSVVGSTTTAEYDSDTYEGKPSLIVQTICDEEGWPVGEIEETETVYDTDGETPKTFARENQTAGKFINSLLQYSKSAETGESDYVFFLGDDGKIYFVSKATKATLKVKQATKKQTNEFFNKKESKPDNKKTGSDSKTKDDLPPKKKSGQTEKSWKKDLEKWYKENANKVEAKPVQRSTETTPQIEERIKKWKKKYPYFEELGAKYVKNSKGKKASSVISNTLGLEMLPQYRGQNESEYYKMLVNIFQTRDYSRFPFELTGLMDKYGNDPRQHYQSMSKNERIQIDNMIKAWKAATGKEPTFSKKVKLTSKEVVDPHNQPDTVEKNLNTAENIVKGYVYAYYKKKGDKFSNGEKFSGSSQVCAAPSQFDFNTVVIPFQVSGHPSGVENTRFRVVDRHSKAVKKTKKKSTLYYIGIPMDSESKVKKFGGTKACKFKAGFGDTNGNEDLKGTTVNPITDTHGDQNYSEGDDVTDTTNEVKYLENVEISAHYEYYSGRTDNTVISFTPEFGDKLKALGGSDIKSVSIDTTRNEMIEVTAGGTKNGKYSKKILGLSSSNAKSLKNHTEALFAAYANSYYTATMEIVGDPNIKTYTYVYIAVYTKYGYIHHSSGVYLIKEVEDSISGGQFITTLSLLRVGTNKSKVVDYTTIDFGGSGSSGAGGDGSDGDGSSGGTDDTTYEVNGTWMSCVKAAKKAFSEQVGYYTYGGRSRQIKINGKKYHMPRNDCSGYVSLCLNVMYNNNYGSSASGGFGASNSKLSTKGWKHLNWPGWDGLKQGDIISQPGSHVEIFSRNANGKHYVYNNGSDSSAKVAGETTDGGRHSYKHVWRPPSD